jgi:hypothetical protein
VIEMPSTSNGSLTRLDQGGFWCWEIEFGINYINSFRGGFAVFGSEAADFPLFLQLGETGSYSSALHG